MKFTYQGYQELIKLLHKERYVITNYHEYEQCGNEPCVILRHDMDSSVEMAYEFASMEQKLGIKSTYFALLSGTFYNIAEKENSRMLKEMYAMGHEIGLHFDEVKYEGKRVEEVKAAAEKERRIMEELLEIPIQTISMHRPSKAVLEADLQFSNMINSYSKTFFKEFKYISDSRLCWREDVEGIICSHEYQRLHILTHPFSYTIEDLSIEERLRKFLDEAKIERYDKFSKNFRDLDEFISRDSI